MPGAEKALAMARRQNPHTEVYLKGATRLPNRLPIRYTMGSKEEAICFAEMLRMAWHAHPNARKWLKEQR